MARPRRPRRGRRRAGAFLSLVCVLAVLAGSSFAWYRHQHRSPYADVPKPTTARLHVVSHRLSAHRLSRVTSVMETDVRHALRQAHRRPLPVGSTVRLEPSTLTADGRQASVAAQVRGPAGRVTKWVVLLTYEHRRWVIYGSERLR